MVRKSHILHAGARCPCSECRGTLLDEYGHAMEMSIDVLRNTNLILKSGIKSTFVP